MFFRAGDTSSLSVIQLNTLVVRFQGIWEYFMESCSSNFLSESWDWSEDLVEVELVYRSDGIVWVGWVEPFGGVRGLLNVAFTWLPLQWIVIFGMMMGFASAVSWLGLGFLGGMLSVWSSVMLFLSCFLSLKIFVGRGGMWSCLCFLLFVGCRLCDHQLCLMFSPCSWTFLLLFFGVWG